MAIYVLTCFNAKSLLFVHSFLKNSLEKDLFALMNAVCQSSVMNGRAEARKPPSELHHEEENPHVEGT